MSFAQYWGLTLTSSFMCTSPFLLAFRHFRGGDHSFVTWKGAELLWFTLLSIQNGVKRELCRV